MVKQMVPGQLEAAVLKAIDRHRDGMFASDLVDEMGASSLVSVRKVLRKLRARGVLVQDAFGRHCRAVPDVPKRKAKVATLDETIADMERRKMSPQRPINKVVERLSLDVNEALTRVTTVLAGSDASADLSADIMEMLSIRAAQRARMYRDRAAAEGRKARS